MSVNVSIVSGTHTLKVSAERHALPSNHPKNKQSRQIVNGLKTEFKAALRLLCKSTQNVHFICLIGKGIICVANQKVSNPILFHGV